MRLRFEYSYDIIIKYGYFINQHKHSLFFKYLLKFIWFLFSIQLINKEILPNGNKFKSFHKNSVYAKYILIHHCKNPCRLYCKTKENNITIISSQCILNIDCSIFNSMYLVPQRVAEYALFLLLLQVCCCLLCFTLFFSFHLRVTFLLFLRLLFMFSPTYSICAYLSK